MLTSNMRSHEMIKAEWTKKCMKIIKSMWQMRRSCWIIDDWAKYIQACDNFDHLMKSAKTDYKLIKLASVKNICLVELLAHKL